jgi:hypothetical protein
MGKAMSFAAMRAGMLAGALLLPGGAQAFTCAQVIWAMQTYSEAELEAMAAKFGGISAADRAKARQCVREAGEKGIRIKTKSVSARPAS